MVVKYKTLENHSEIKYQVKDSTFIANSAPVDSRDDAEEFIEDISSKYSDASHNVFAYRIRGIGIHRYDDDGEPSGSAGKPVLKALENKEVENAVVVVSRYFGGTELGYGGLVRAYNNSAVNSIEESKVITEYEKTTLKLKLDYKDINNVKKVLKKYNSNIRSEEYYDTVNYSINVREDKVEGLKNHLMDETSGRIDFI